jgi:4-amino-4-deoxy-L-arabinose transferase-like glycosyltransferase
MSSRLTHAPQSPVRRIFWHLETSGLPVAVLFFLFLLWRAPHQMPGDFDYDEGINLAKTMLVSQGHSLYAEIWSDQPPLLTHLLVGWFKLFGSSVEQGRLLIMLFSSLLVGALYSASRHLHDIRPHLALAGVLLLVTSAFYLRLSGAIMVGLPALAVATVAVAVLAHGREQLWRRVLSALLLAVAIQIKLLAAVAAPAMIAYLLVAPNGSFGQIEPRQGLRRLAEWAAVLLGAFLAIGWVTGSLRIDQLLAPHLETQSQAFQLESPAFFLDFLLNHPGHLLLAVWAIQWGWRGRRRVAILPIVWFHHVLLLTIPLAWLGVLGLWRLEELLLRPKRWIAPPWRQLLAVGLLALVIALVGWRPAPLPSRLDEQMSIYRPLYVWEMRQQLQADAGNRGPDDRGYVFTDRPFYAFEAGLPVSPPIAVLSRKRMETGAISEADMVAALTHYTVYFAVLERFSGQYPPAVMEILARDYEEVMVIEPAHYYRRRP